jgi:hypothetical protein
MKMKTPLQLVHELLKRFLNPTRKVKTSLELMKGFLTFFASPADQQLEYLRLHRQSPEVFIKKFVAAYEDLAATALDMLERGELDGRQCHRIKKLGDWLREMRGEDDLKLWTGEALRSAWQWESVREMAQDCLLVFEPAP